MLADKTVNHLDKVAELEKDVTKWTHRTELGWTLVVIMILLLAGCINAGRACLEVPW